MSDKSKSKKLTSIHKKVLSRKRKIESKYAKSRIIYNRPLAELEDSNNLNTISRLAASGTSYAYRRAWEISNEIILVVDGKVIRQVKGKKPEVIEDLNPRKVTKGATLSLQIAK
ncbi:MAG: hypothetical protein COZ75_00830 [Flavobacteriaceae bacterium CG_4_8_14_3_um_filter_34_10]|nr:hypothetical protein [Flavobacteriia bacterium]PIQ18370.1 MAG: hypothetical protein COW66_06820 [Flavobacteriaceae bacterium CG18_big_fil_WC_8_21_14_2_50_34_36]PIV49162.1 MAG: hypothetical protein COS19_10075 [Flavobacteriaceae bacterium CG02_land_8_20_14_3_00_34_13]PIX10589.1 MAG: hypothetical protein COZ75_00830 [Flavobacteriaceae bacterium CG_4_8_14_3_um_filter_34_10]PIZ08648.1 MAG: hypothetical protein COY56_02780 [Flavobacteriaceae bacterium CG_4_10_14_0_8_um_filter_34_31]PJC07681.1 MA